MENEKICPKCGARADGDSAFCAKCGAKMDEKIFCHECGAEVKPGSEFCQACGAPLNKKAEKALKSSLKEKTDASKEIIASGKERTKLRKISDMLLFIATAILLVFPFISFVEMSGAIYSPGFKLFGTFVQFPTGYLWGIIQILSSLDWLFNFSNIGLAVIIRAIFAIGLIIYFIVLSIVSFVSIITSTVNFAKGKSYNITSKALKSLIAILSFALYSSILSSNALDVKLSSSMKLMLGLSILLMLAACAISFAESIKKQFVSKKAGFGAIFSLAMLVFSLVTALAFTGFRCYDYYKRIYFVLEGNDIAEIFYAFAALLAFPAMIFGLILLSNNIKTLKKSFKEACYINYVSREEKTLYRHVLSKKYATVAYAVLASIFLTISFTICSLDVARSVIGNYSTVAQFMEAVSNNFFEIFADFISATVRTLPSMSFPIFIWAVSVVALVAKCVCNSLAKKQIESAMDEVASNEKTDTPPTEIKNEDAPVEAKAEITE